MENILHLKAKSHFQLKIEQDRKSMI